MKKKYLILCLIFLGCAAEKTEKALYDVKLNRLEDNTFEDAWSDNLTSIPVYFNSKKIHSNELFSSIEYLPLETTPESFFGTIDQLELTDDQIIILDKKTRGVYVFDKTGNFQFKIDQVGEGPTEYRIPKFMAYNPFHKRIEVLDNTRGLIQRYSAEDGRYLSTLDLGMGINEFTPLHEASYLLVVGSYAFNDQRYAQIEGLNKQLLIANEVENSIKIVSQHVDYRENSGVPNFGINQNLRVDSRSGLPLVNITYNDTIYEVSQSRINRKYYIDFGEYKNPDEWFRKENLRTFLNKSEEGEYTSVTYFWDVSGYIYLSSRYQGLTTHCFYSKSSGESKCFRKSDYMQAAGAFGGWPISVTDTDFVYIMEPQEVYGIKESVLNRINALYPEAQPTDVKTIIDTFYVAQEKWEFLKLTESAIKEDSNPVLVFVKPNFEAYD